MPEAQNYTLGRGEVHFARFAAGTQTPGGERYLGNTPELSFAVESESLDHYNSDHGVKEKDASITLQVDRNGNISCDNISFDNLALMWFGTAAEVTTSASTADTEQFANVELGLSYQIGISAAAPAGLRSLANLSVSADPSGTPVPLVADTDYTVDLARGRITLLEGASNVADGDTIEVTYDVKASTRTQVVSGNTPIEGALRFIADNPEGENIDYYLPWVKLTPDGDYQLKGDEWQQMGFSIEILKKSGLEAVYADGQPAAIP